MYLGYNKATYAVNGIGFRHASNVYNDTTTQGIVVRHYYL